MEFSTFWSLLTVRRQQRLALNIIHKFLWQRPIHTGTIGNNGPGTCPCLWPVWMFLYDQNLFVGAPTLRPKISQLPFHAVFWKILHNHMLEPPRGSAPLLRGILDSPLLLILVPILVLCSVNVPLLGRIQRLFLAVRWWTLDNLWMFYPPLEADVMLYVVHAVMIQRVHPPPTDHFIQFVYLWPRRFSCLFTSTVPVTFLPLCVRENTTKFYE